MHPNFIIVDLFCGAGGTTTGFENSKECKVIACVNHDANAIKSHAANHPECLHFTEDIRTLDLSLLVSVVAKYKALYPDAFLILWASLECTNFSKAKGGQPRDGDSRSLADHMEQYVTALHPDYFMIENVVEFMSWGPLDDNGRPISRKNGCDYMRWCNEIDALGYYNEWRELNAANFGAYTSRNRLFGIFAMHGLPIVWPEATHSKKPSHSLFGASLQKWKAVKDVLDFTDEGKSIFYRKKPLSDKTLQRIMAGLIKFVAGGKDAFLLKYNSTSQKGVHIPPSVDEPCPVVACQNRLGIAFIQKYHGNGDNLHSVEAPCPTIATKDQCGLVKPVFIMRDFTSGGNNTSVDVPAGSVLPSPKLNLVTAQPFVMATNFDNQPSSIEDPLSTITANRKWHYLVNPSHGGHVTNTDDPCPVVVARQDKAPLYLVVSEGGDIAIRVQESDSEDMVKIKEFMVLYGIVDIKMRMLKIPELLKIQGFPEDYTLIGTQADQKKFIGNAVHPLVPDAMAKALINKLYSSGHIAA